MSTKGDSRYIKNIRKRWVKSRVGKKDLLLERLITCKADMGGNYMKLREAYSKVLDKLSDDVLANLFEESFFFIDGSSRCSFCQYNEEGLINNEEGLTNNDIKNCVFISKGHIELSLKALTAVVAHELAHVYDFKTVGIFQNEKRTEMRAMDLVAQWGFREELEKLDEEINWRWHYYRQYVDKPPYKYIQKAKRRHICHDCEKNIEAGEKYCHVTKVIEDQATGPKHKEICLSCYEYGEVLICMRWAYGQVTTKRKKINKVVKLKACSRKMALKAYDEIAKQYELNENIRRVDIEQAVTDGEIKLKRIERTEFGHPSLTNLLGRKKVITYELSWLGLDGDSVIKLDEEQLFSWRSARELIFTYWERVPENMWPKDWDDLLGILFHNAEHEK